MTQTQGGNRGSSKFRSQLNKWDRFSESDNKPFNSITERCLLMDYLYFEESYQKSCLLKHKSLSFKGEKKKKAFK